MQQPKLPVATEGVPFILFSGFATLILALIGFALPALLCLLLTGFVTYFFRDPTRVVPADSGAVVCPADGKVIQVREVDDNRFSGQRAMKISIFMNVFNVHVNRIPMAGTVDRVFLSPGAFYAADKDKAELHNEYCALTITTPAGLQYAVVQLAGLVARRIVCWAEKGDQVDSGQRFGLIRFGSRVDLYLPLSVQVLVRTGEKVRAGETVLGFLQEGNDRGKNQESIA